MFLLVLGFVVILGGLKAYNNTHFNIKPFNMNSAIKNKKEEIKHSQKTYKLRHGTPHLD